MKPQGHKKKDFNRRRPTLEKSSIASSGLFFFTSGEKGLIFGFWASVSFRKHQKKSQTLTQNKQKKSRPAFFFFLIDGKEKKFLNSKFLRHQTIGVLFWNLFFVTFLLSPLFSLPKFFLSETELHEKLFWKN